MSQIINSGSNTYLMGVKLKYIRTCYIPDNNVFHYFQLIDKFGDNKELQEFRTKTKLKSFWGSDPSDADKHFLYVAKLPREFSEGWLHKQIYDCDIKISRYSFYPEIIRIVKDPFYEVRQIKRKKLREHRTLEILEKSIENNLIFN